MEWLFRSFPVSWLITFYHNIKLFIGHHYCFPKNVTSSRELAPLVPGAAIILAPQVASFDPFASDVKNGINLNNPSFSPDPALPALAQVAYVRLPK